VIFALLVALSAPVTAQAGALGVVADSTLPTTSSEAWTAITTDLKATVVRVDVRWADVAPAAPANPALPNSRGYDWTAVDARVRAASASGAIVLLSVGGTPEWARADGGRGGAPGDPAWNPRRSSWRNFVTALATRYNGTFSVGGSALPRVAAFEIWPAPNLVTSLRPQRLSQRLVGPGWFKVIVAGASAEIRKVAAQNGYTATIVAGGAARTPIGPTADTSPAVFLRGMARTRVAIDAVGLRLTPPAGVETAEPGALSLTDFAGVLAAVDAAWPGQDRRLWVTGYGVDSGPAEAGRSPETQAAAVGVFLAAAANPRVDAAIWSGFQDTSGAPYTGLRSQSLPESTEPIEQAIGAPKPAWATWVAALN
jgi:hypothetical protein